MAVESIATTTYVALADNCLPGTGEADYVLHPKYGEAIGVPVT